MAFIRKKLIKGNYYDYEVKSVREGRSVRQVHIRYIGRSRLGTTSKNKKSVPAPVPVIINKKSVPAPVIKNKSENYDKIFASAIKTFPLTDNFEKAGYILPDGRMLDLSSGQETREQDHREIRKVKRLSDKKLFKSEALKEIYDKGDSVAMFNFMNMGAIRFSKTNNQVIINSIKKPTEKQIKKLQDAIKYSDSLIFDRTNFKNGDILNYFEKDNPEPRDIIKIIGFWNEKN